MWLLTLWMGISVPCSLLAGALLRTGRGHLPSAPLGMDGSVAVLMGSDGRIHRMRLDDPSRV